MNALARSRWLDFWLSKSQIGCPAGETKCVCYAAQTVWRGRNDSARRFSNFNLEETIMGKGNNSQKNDKKNKKPKKDAKKPAAKSSSK